MKNWKIHHRAETASTNLDAREGRPGDVFTADFQTAGRGRLDHKWLAPPKTNVLMSVVLDASRLPIETAATLPLVVGLAVLRGVSPFLGRSSTRLKWPNDVLVDGRKVAGILCERHGDNIIAGIGINVKKREFPPELQDRAVTIEDCPRENKGSVPSVEAVRDAVLAELGRYYERIADGGFAAVYPELRAVDFLRGQTLAVLQTDGDTEPVRGICGGIRPDGALDVGGTPVYAGEAHVLSCG